MTPTSVFSLRHGDGQVGVVQMFVQEATPLGADNLVLAHAMVEVASIHLVGAHRRGERDGFIERSLEKSLYDELTGLPNRSLFLEHLDHARHPDSPSALDVAILFVEVDRATINAHDGRLAGDEVLVAAGKRLRALGQVGGVVAQLAKAEFANLYQWANSSLDTEKMADRVRLALAVPFIRGEGASMIAARVGSARLARHLAPEIRGLDGPKSGHGWGMWCPNLFGSHDQQLAAGSGLGTSRR